MLGLSADEQLSSSNADTEASGSEPEGEGTESEELPSIPNTLPDSDIPATAIRVLFNKRLRHLKRRMEDILQESNRDRYAVMERRQAEKKGSRAEKRCRKQQQNIPRIQAQAYLALIAPNGRVKVSMSGKTDEHSPAEESNRSAYKITHASGLKANSLTCTW